jgi:hypothetical protein
MAPRSAGGDDPGGVPGVLEDVRNAEERAPLFRAGVALRLVEDSKKCANVAVSLLDFSATVLDAVAG